MSPHHLPRTAVAAGLLVLGACTGTSPAADTAETSGDVDYVLLLDDDSDPDQVQGEPGTYALTARGDATPPLAVLDVPAGFSNFGFFALWPTGSADGTEEPFRAVSYWTVHGVFADPCRRAGEAAPPAGTSVEDLAAALVDQELTAVSEPRPVVLDGHEGLYLELTVPADVRFADCEIGYYAFWEGRANDAQHVAESPGTVERTWIIDVDGERVVLNAMTVPGVTVEQTDELIKMVESVRFVSS